METQTPQEWMVPASKQSEEVVAAGPPIKHEKRATISLQGLLGLNMATSKTKRKPNKKKGDAETWQIPYKVGMELIVYIFEEKLQQDLICNASTAPKKVPQPLPLLCRDVFIRRYGIKSLALKNLNGLNEMVRGCAKTKRWNDRIEVFAHVLGIGKTGL